MMMMLMLAMDGRKREKRRRDQARERGGRTVFKYRDSGGWRWSDPDGDGTEKCLTRTHRSSHLPALCWSWGRRTRTRLGRGESEEVETGAHADLTVSGGAVSGNEGDETDGKAPADERIQPARAESPIKVPPLATMDYGRAGDAMAMTMRVMVVVVVMLNERASHCSPPPISA